MAAHGGTGNLKNHLMRKHPAVWAKINTSCSTPSVSKYVHSTPEWKRNGEKSKEMDRFLARFIISGNLPLHIVENEWFQRLVRKEYILPGRTYFGKNV